MHFRDAVMADLPVIVSIYNSTIESRMVTADMIPVTVDGKKEWFNDHDPSRRPLWMVEDDARETIGWVSFQDFYGRPAYDQTAEISIYLHPDVRGKKLGRMILEYAIEHCPSLQITTLLGFIFEQNIPSLKLFHHLGFEEWAHLKDIANFEGKHCSLKILGRKV